MKKILYIASDHAGHLVKEDLVVFLKSLNYVISDLGTNDSQTSVDYPSYAITLCEHLLKERESLGILICGTGIGMSIVANKFKGIRAALCSTEEEAKLSKEHNNANILCLGARMHSKEKLLKIVRVWLETPPPSEDSRHQKRLEIISSLGQNPFIMEQGKLEKEKGMKDS